MRFRNVYTSLGLGLVGAGVGLTPVFYLLLRSVPLTALGISMLILGAVCFALGRACPRIPPEASALLLETGLENMAALVEELGLRSKAIYLPSVLTNGRPQALIPLHSNPSLPEINKALPQRLIVKYGPNPEDIGLLVTTPGSATPGMLEAKPGATSSEMEAALTSVLAGVLDLADGVSINKSGEIVGIVVSHPRLEYKNMQLYQNLGSPLASIVASITAEALNQPLIVEREEYKQGECHIELRLV